MRRSSSAADDSLDSANRRSSGRARKLTAKYQALAGTKFLPVDSSNQAGDDTGDVPKSSSPDDAMDDFEPSMSPVGSMSQPRRRSTKHQQSDSVQSGLTDDHGEVPQSQTHSDITLETLEQSNTRSRRERKPTAKAREAMEARGSSVKSTSPTMDETQAEFSSPTAQAIAPTVELAPEAVQTQRASRRSTVVETPAPTTVKVEERSVSPLKSVTPSSKSSFARKRLRTSAGTFARADGSVTPAKKRSASAKSNTPKSAPASTASKKLSTVSVPAPISLDVDNRDEDNIAIANPIVTNTITSESPGVVGTEDHNVLAVMEAVLQGDKTRFNKKRPAAETNAQEPPTKVTKLTLNPPKRPNPVKRPSNLRFSVSSADQGPMSQPVEKDLVNGVGKEGATQKARKPSSKGKERAVEQPVNAINHAPMQQVAQNGAPKCNLFCLSPSARILAFAQLAAESSDSDDDDDAAAASGGLYNKWLAEGRERFCVCASNASAHAHPVPAPAAQPPEPVVASRIFPLPPVNSVMSAAEGRRVSALYNALTDTQMPLGLIRRTPFD
jgi:hypothetical protein